MTEAEVLQAEDGWQLRGGKAEITCVMSIALPPHFIPLTELWPNNTWSLLLSYA